jgi:hypothetical protein
MLLGVVLTSTVACRSDGDSSDKAMQRFDFGDPSPEEQQIWFLVNRARSDPPAEGRWLANTDDQLVSEGIKAFGIDVTQLVADFDEYTPQPPVAWDPRLARAAARHAADQAVHRTQEHREQNGSQPADRVRTEGVKSTYLAETISGHVHSPVFGHAAFQIDWGGPPPTGVQDWPKPGHRMAIMSADPGRPVTNAVGMAWLPVSTDDGFGPNVLVQEFARIDETFIVGTVWTDRNGNGTLDFGEGLDAVKVVPNQGPWYARTASEGSYALPVTQGTYTISVTRAGYTTVHRQVNIGTENALVNIELTA